MKIIFLVNSQNGASTRYRVDQYLPYFRENNWDYQRFVVPENLKERISLFRSLKKFDIVFLQKRLLGWFSTYLLRKNSKILVFDYDDSIMFRDSNKYKFSSIKKRKRFKTIIKLSDIIIAGNDYLKNQAIRYNKNVFVIPTPIDMERYQPKIYTQNYNHIILGWIGSKSTIFYLKQIKNILDSIFFKYPNTRLKIVADSFLECDKIPVIKKKWKYEEEIDDLHSFDIGLNPLTDDPWSRGKCGFKLLQYMAIGIPSVCSKIGVNKEIIKNGVNGFLATDEKSWYENISNLINNLNLRKK
jgi:glycosyltransferase involved in cell wall biosynthesis